MPNDELIRPLGGGVLVAPDIPDESQGGIIIPEVARQRPKSTKTAKVLAIGPGVRMRSGQILNLASDLKPGDRVVLTRWGGRTIEVDGVECLIVDSDDIAAIIGERVQIE